MDFWIKYPPEPDELLLVWQAPLTVGDRLRWAVGRLRAGSLGGIFSYIVGAEFAALNLERSPETLRAAGYSGYPAFDVRECPDGGFRDHVLEAFLRRIPPQTRTDFPNYLAHYHIERTTPLSPMALLAVTEARLPSDDFSLVDPLNVSASRVDLVFEIAGYRFSKEAVQVGQSLSLRPEPSNPKDPLAVQVCANGRGIGYVNRLQALTIGKWLEHREVNCWVSRINGRPEAPRAFAFLQVRPVARTIAA